MLKSYKTNSAEETIELGKKIGNLLKSSDVILLTGDLSAGKTTLTKGIGISLGVTKIINSPTFTIVKEYKGKCPLYHLDLYRLDGLNNDFDLEEFIEGDGVCVIEWPYQVEEILPKEYLEINLKRLSEFERSIEVKAIGSRYEEVLKKL
ncbi:MAG: tRNA (adenosine(37)-N6)-threonylcarbamoyltransferase complex ATPase subunit type 1 TsaE [Anaeroplasmataceae bacterium]|nr:tRNA (adenosine(37)-N6)-threonylcarbamoyltransferase complex ATPase subunit type 1 TsaE [Anaeroplasmataceae bacterium]